MDREEEVTRARVNQRGKVRWCEWRDNCIAVLLVLALGRVRSGQEGKETGPSVWVEGRGCCPYKLTSARKCGSSKDSSFLVFFLSFYIFFFPFLRLEKLLLLNCNISSSTPSLSLLLPYSSLPSYRCWFFHWFVQFFVLPPIYRVTIFLAVRCWLFSFLYVVYLFLLWCRLLFFYVYSMSSCYVMMRVYFFTHLHYE